MSRIIPVIFQAKIDGYKRNTKEAAKATGEIGDAAEKADKAAGQSLGAFKNLSDAAGISIGKTGEAMETQRSAMTKLGQIAQENEAAWNGVAGSLAIVGAAAAGIAGLAVREFANFDQAMSGVASTGEDAKSNIEGLREAAIEMGADTAFSATEAANGVEELARAGVAAEEILAGGLAGALDLAAAGQIGVAEAAGIASTAMTQFKLSGEEIPHLADLLAAGAGKAMGGVDDLGMALKQSGLVASQFGLSIEETVGGLSAFAAAGLLGSDAGTSMKSMLLALANPAGATAKKMAELGINAYTASGEFIGLEGLARNLRTSLADLTDAQRQQALAQIFGTDAIRAASILYEEGAEGIAEWTDAVNDAGYASETAAELQNNLIGDLEKLGGSWSTLAIQMGEVADGPLRSVVQGLTNLLDIAGSSPAAANAIMITVSAVAALGLGTAGLMKGISVVADLKTNLTTLGASAGAVDKVTGAIGKVGRVAGTAALGFGALAIVAGIIDQWVPAVADVDNLTDSLERMADGVGNVDNAFKRVDGSQLTYYVDDVSSAMERFADRGWKYMDQLDGINDFFGSFGGPFESWASDLTLIERQFTGIAESMLRMEPDRAAAVFTQLAAQAKEAGLSTEEFMELMAPLSDRIRDQLHEINMSGEGFQSYATDAQSVAKILSGEIPEGLVMTADGLKTTAQAAQDAGPPFDAYAASQERAAASAEAHEDALKETVGILAEATEQAQAYGNALLALSGSQIGVEAAIDAATEALEKNGKTLDLDTEKGRANQQALNSLAGAGQQLIQTMFEQGAATEDIIASTEKSKKAFIDTAVAMGMLPDEAAQLAEAYFAIPSEVDTWLRSQGLDAALADKQRWQDALDDLSEEEVTEFLTELDGQSESEVRGRLDALARDRTVNVNVRQIGGEIVITPTVRGGGRGISIPGNKDGGAVWGPGTSTSDSILRRLSDGEYVLKTKAAQMIGYSTLDYMNATGKVPKGHADGGGVWKTGPRAMESSGRFSSPVAVARGGGDTYNTILNLDGREAMSVVLEMTRDADLNRYGTNGVHDG